MKSWRRLLMVCIIMFVVCMIKVDASAEVVWNWNHETFDGTAYDDNLSTTTPYMYKFWNGEKWWYEGVGKFPTDEDRAVPITYEVTYDYEEAYKMLDLVNAERRKAGVPELKANDRMMQVAMERAAQTCCYWKHQIPDGSSINEFSMFIDSENIGGGGDSAEAANNSLVHSEGHYKNMINKNWKYAGFGCVSTPQNGTTWIQIYCNNVDSKGSNNLYEIDGYPDKPIDMDAIPYGGLKNYTENYTSYINPKFTEMRIKRVKEDNINVWRDYSGAWRDESDWKIGEKIYIGIMMVSPFEYSGASEEYSKVVINRDSYTVKSSDSDIIEVQDGDVICKKAGKANIAVYLNANPAIYATTEIEVKEKEIKNGSKITVGNLEYKVTDKKSKTVSLIGGQKSVAKASIPDTVKIQGKTYKVTAVAANAFKNSKKLTSVTIGKNVTTIGKNAFYGCSGLKKITVKTTKLKSVGKNALKGIHKKAVVKVPKKKFAKYKKLLKGKGQKKTVRLRK